MFNAISSQARNLVNLTRASSKKTKTKVVTITSGKGGVGKSTFTANISYLLAKRGYKIAVVDADIGLANMQVLFDIRPKLTLFDYIEGRNTISEVTSNTNFKNVSLVAGKSGYQYSNLKNSLVLSRVIEDLKELNIYDIVLIDTGAGLNSYVQEFLSISNNVVALTTTDPSALTDVYALMKMLSLDKEKLLLCFNHTKNYKIGEAITTSLVNLAKKNSLNQNFMVKYIGNVSTSANISTTSRLRKLFAHEFANDDITKQLQGIIDILLNDIK
ncbi:MAG: AAA family ATPase [Halarcobacter sp.]